MTSFRALGTAQLVSLCRAVGFNVSTAVQAFETMLGSWGEWQVGSAPRWPCDITDDGTPYEFSLGMEGGAPEPRFLVESQGHDGSLSAAWDAAKETNERLRRRYGISLERLALIEDLFTPRYAQAKFAMWHAVWLRTHAAPLFKVYLNPEAQGPAEAPRVVEEALARLGFSGTWPLVEKLLAQRPGANRLIYFSLDLAHGGAARVKLYMAHDNACAEDVEPVLALAPEYLPGDAVRFCRLTTSTTGPFTARPLISCLSFTSDAGSRPTSVTLHMPIRCYVDNDHEAAVRICNHLGATQGVFYRRALEALASRPLDAGVGMQTYVSYRRLREQVRTTVYLAPEAYAVLPRQNLAALSEQGTWMAPQDTLTLE